MIIQILFKEKRTQKIQRKLQKYKSKSNHILFFRFKILKSMLDFKGPNGTFDTHIGIYYC